MTAAPFFAPPCLSGAGFLSYDWKTSTPFSPCGGTVCLDNDRQACHAGSTGLRTSSCLTASESD
jgi:hypothetical protein